MTLNKAKYACVGGLAALLALAGCASSAPKTALTPPPVPRTVEVSFPKEIDYVRDFTVFDQNDPAQLVNFALSLSQQGRHLQAAEFFRDAANNFVSRDNDFRVACRAAAANEFLLANDVNSFRETTAQLRRELNRFQLAGADEPLAMVLSLGDIASGVDKPSSITPKPLWDVYPQNKKATLASNE
jgi:hypothetical protein